jgi:hypothetical protein
MKVVNVLHRRDRDVLIVGNKEALRALVNACLEAITRKSASADVLDTRGDPYAMRVEVVESIADLVKLPLK